VFILSIDELAACDQRSY